MGQQVLRVRWQEAGGPSASPSEGDIVADADAQLVRWGGETLAGPPHARWGWGDERTFAQVIAEGLPGVAGPASHRFEIEAFVRANDRTEQTFEWVKAPGVPPHFGEARARAYTRLIRWTVGTDREKTRARAAEFGITEEMLRTWPPHADVGWRGQQTFADFLAQGPPELVGCPADVAQALRAFVEDRTPDEAP